MEGKGSDHSIAGFNAALCSSYNDALASYQTQQAAYDAAWSSWTSAQAAWQTETDARYEALDSKIEAYNNGFAGAVIRAWTQYAVTRTETQSRVLRSDPGQISAGGDLLLSGDTLINDKSRMLAGGLLRGDLNNLTNLEAEGQHIVRETGTSQTTRSRWRGGFKRYHQRDWDPAIPYTPADQITTIVLPVTQLVQGVNASGSSGTAPSRAANGSVASSLSLAGLPALFRLQSTPGTGPLIETDPRFANYRQWLSSDYLLSQLASDPATTQKRLGDGFYEQRLLREQDRPLCQQRQRGHCRVGSPRPDKC